MNLSDIVVVDTETTGLDPDNDPIWEVAAARADGTTTAHWFLPIDVGRVSDWVREHTGICERYDLANLTPIPQFLDEFEAYVSGAHLAGNVVSFDAERIGRLYRHAGRKEPWHYHLIDVEAVAVGWLLARGRTIHLPWNSRLISEAVGITVPVGLHDAMVDALWALDVLIACTVGGTSTALTPEGAS